MAPRRHRIRGGRKRRRYPTSINTETPAENITTTTDNSVSSTAATIDEGNMATKKNSDENIYHYMSEVSMDISREPETKITEAIEEKCGTPTEEKCLPESVVLTTEIGTQDSENNVPLQPEIMEIEIVPCSVDISREPETKITEVVEEKCRSPTEEKCLPESVVSPTEISTQDLENTAPLQPKTTEMEIVLSSGSSVLTLSADIVKSAATENEKVDSKKWVYKEDVLMFYDLVERLAQRLKTSENKGQLMMMLQKVFALTEEKGEQKANKIFKLLNTFTSDLEDCNLEYLNYVEERLGEILLPKELKKLVITDDMVKNLYQVIGRGAFGAVTKGWLRINDKDQPYVDVAIKELKDENYYVAFIEEAKVMSQLDHNSILKLLGMTVEKKSVKLILEYMDCADLVTAITSRDLTLSCQDMLTIILDIASGMEYISLKKYVHRDLTLKNILVSHNKVCKIGDFGFCKYVGDLGVYKEKEFIVQGKSVAPETRETGEFSTKSDVWAMGSLIWDLFSLSAVRDHSEDVLELLFTISVMWERFHQTGILVRVRSCPQNLHNFVADGLLNRNPKCRPEFRKIKLKILKILNDLYPHIYPSSLIQI